MAKKGCKSWEFKSFGSAISVISYQLSVISYQLLVISPLTVRSLIFFILSKGEARYLIFWP
ncbi:MAG: hypothetical protein F6K17_15300 [Okeania sp. SIO3C4]|nr:hypothetical protein [Okeania sp. SIO3C4]